MSKKSKKAYSKNQICNSERDHDVSIHYLDLCYSRYKDAYDLSKHLQIRIAGWATFMVTLCLALVKLTNADLKTPSNYNMTVYEIFLLLSWGSLIHFYVYIMLAEFVSDVKELPPMKDWNKYFDNTNSNFEKTIKEITNQFAEGEDSMFNLYQKRLTYFKKSQIMACITSVFMIISYIICVLAQKG